MPVYEYRCNNCNSVFEVEHLMEDKYEHLDCPVCKINTKVEKLISLSSFRCAWRITLHPGAKTPVRQIGGQLYDEKSYNTAIKRGQFGNKKS